MLTEQEYTTDPKRQAEMIREFRRGAVPLTTSVQLLLDAATMRPQFVPCAHLATKKFPHLRVLQRRMRTTGTAGDVLSGWKFILGMQAHQQLAKIDAHWQKPVRLSVPLIFDLVADREMLERAARSGMIQLILDQPPGALIVESIVLPIEIPELRHALALTAPFAQAQRK